MSIRKTLENTDWGAKIGVDTAEKELRKDPEQDATGNATVGNTALESVLEPAPHVPQPGGLEDDRLAETIAEALQPLGNPKNHQL